MTRHAEPGPLPPGSTDRLSLLLIEDNPGDARLMRELLAEAPGSAPVITLAETLAEARGQVGRFDAVITDLSLPDSTGMETIDTVLRAFPDCPVVVMTGLSDEEIGVRAVQAGCQDYLVKGSAEPDLLARTLRYAIQRKALERALKESEDRFRALVEVAPDTILLVDGDVVTFANPAAAKLFRLPDGASLAGRSLDAVMTGPEGGMLHEAAGVLLTAEGDTAIEAGEYALEALDGTPVVVEAALVPIAIRGHRGLQVVLRDVTARKAAERELRLAQVAFSTSAEAMMVTDDRVRIVAVNPAFSAITGYAPDEVVGHNPNMLQSGRHDTAFYDAMWNELSQNGHWRGEVWNRRKDGAVYVQRLTISRVDDESGQPVNYIAIFSDITEQKLENDAMRHHASHDHLTGLPNRLLFRDRLDQAVAKAARSRSGMALMFIDLDGFKPVNDIHGHLAGDQLLQGVAERLVASLRESDTVARLGGDEFVVLSLDIGGREGACELAGKLLDRLNAPFDLPAGPSVRIGGSIGIALLPEHGDSAEVLLERADEAMYAVKRKGKGSFAFVGDLS